MSAGDVHDHSGPDWRCEACKPLAGALRRRMTWPSLHWGNLHDDAFPSLARAIFESPEFADLVAQAKADGAQAVVDAVEASTKVAAGSPFAAKRNALDAARAAREGGA